MVRRFCGCLGAPPTAVCGGIGGGGAVGGSGTADFDEWVRAVPMNESHLACAIDRLERMSAVLIAERLELAPPLLRKRFGWAIDVPGVVGSEAIAGRAGSRREGAVRFRAYESDAAVLAVLHKRHALDLRLYNRALEIACRAAEPGAG